MMAAYNVPCLPLLVAQSAFDDRFDARYGTARAFTVRLLASMIGMAACLCIVPFGGQGLTLAAVALVGVFDSVAYGTSSQFFSLFPRAVGGYYFIGASLTSVISIALTFATGCTGADPPEASVRALYFTAALLILVGLAAALVLLRSPIGRHYLAEKDATAGSTVTATVDHARDDMEAALLEGDEPTKRAETGGAAGSGTWAVLQLTALSHASIAVCWCTTNWVDSLIAYVPSQRDTSIATNAQFRQVVLFCSLLGELAGKQLNIVRRGRIIRSPRALLAFICLRALLPIPFLLYLMQPLLGGSGTYHWRSDAAYGAFQVR